MKFIYLISYETLLKHITTSDNILYKLNVPYILVSNYPKMRYYKIWMWCFFKGILPNEIHLSKKLFKKDLYCLRKYIQTIKTDKKILIVTDNDDDINSIRDIINIQFCDFITFEKYLNDNIISNLEPFN